ncbi:MAG TPA: S8 family peptidase [Anaerolineae bacterium]|nr:S8 family peptidase [Anaerolineae bacterium]
MKRTYPMGWEPRRARVVALLLIVVLSVSWPIRADGPTADGGTGNTPATSAGADLVGESSAQLRDRSAVVDALSEPHAPGQLLVKWGGGGKSLRTRRAQADLLASVGATVSRDLPSLDMSLVRVEESLLGAALTHLQADGRVEWAEPNYLLKIDFVPDDPYYASHQANPLWGGYLLNMEMEAAWTLSRGDPSVVIAIIDTGIDFGHSDLAPGIWANQDEIAGNGLDDDDNGYVDDVTGWDFCFGNNLPQDLHGHGTHVSGIAAARINNGLGVAGVAGEAAIMPLGIFHPQGFGTYADLIEAIIYATDNGARVINMSLGAVSYSRGEEAAVNYAWEHGVLLVAAAGNNDNDAMHYPAQHDNVLAVSAVTASDSRSSFSTYGDFVDLSAPGSSIISSRVGNGYGLMNGTSMAAPHVAGLAALIFSRNPSLTNGEVRQILESTADDLGEAGWDRFYGHGRVNGRRALEATPLPEPPVPPPPLPPSPQPLWPPHCLELVGNGGFEDPLLALWQLGGEASLDKDVTYDGDRSLQISGTPDSSGETWQLLTLPSDATVATLFFAFRIISQDHGFGSDPNDPFDDRLTVGFRSTSGAPLVSLLRAGNSSDGAPGLPWDEYFYRLTAEDLELLRSEGVVQLHFAADNDGDEQVTLFHVDNVRFCAGWEGMRQRVFLPLTW